VAYVYASAKGEPCAKTFLGKSLKSKHNFRFLNTAQRDVWLKDFFSLHGDNERRNEAYKAEQRKNRTSPTTLKVGDILVSSWGYEQTNIEFYQVVKVVGNNSIDIRRVADDRTSRDGGFTGMATPIADQFVEETQRRRAGADNTVKFSSFQYASEWDGRPKAWTAYA